MALVSAAALRGAFKVRYGRARAELVIPKCTVGLMERPERITLIAAGSRFGFFHVAAWSLAVTTRLTAFHRVFYTRRAIKAPQERGFD